MFSSFVPKWRFSKIHLVGPRPKAGPKTHNHTLQSAAHWQCFNRAGSLKQTVRAHVQTHSWACDHMGQSGQCPKKQRKCGLLIAVCLSNWLIKAFLEIWNSVNAALIKKTSPDSVSVCILCSHAYPCKICTKHFLNTVHIPLFMHHSSDDECILNLIQ